MSTVFTLYKQIHPATGIELSIYCNLVHPTEKCLVVAGVNQLQVYKLAQDCSVPEEAAGAASGASASRADKTGVNSQRVKLECFASFQLFGNIVSMQSVRLANSTQDALLLSFRDAKLSVIEYDPSTHDLKTLSLHYFEDDDLKDGRLQHVRSLPTIRVDPDGRCAAMLTYSRRLVVLPFRRDVTGGGVGAPAEPTVSGSLGQMQVLSSYIIDLHKMDEKIVSVLDFQFLYGYHEPTVVLLHEPLPTWAGRIAVRKDTCSVLALSLNLEQRVSPVIWSLDNLPFDCQQIVPVRKPIGGMLVMAVNSLLYLNQSFPPFGVSLNSLTNGSTDFLLRPLEGSKLTLDGCQVCDIATDKFVLSLRGGELFVLTLVTDGMRAVRNFHMDKAASCVQTTCMCECGDRQIFLGSRLGNSLLVRYLEKTLSDPSTTSQQRASFSLDEPEKDLDEPALKKRKDIIDWISSSMTYDDDLEELEVYGGLDSRQTAGSAVTQYMFEVLDSLVNIGPCGQTVIGEPACLSEEFGGLEDVDMELVSTSGYGKNGALSVLQRSIRPQVVTTFELPGCIDMWTVVGGTGLQKKSDQTEGGSESSLTHTLLILSTADSSMVLRTGQEIMELDQTGFNTQDSTVYAGNIGKNRYILQVSARGFRLLDGTTQLLHVPLDLGGSPITCCSVADPHVVLMTQDGQLLFLRLDDTGTGPKLPITRPQDHQTSQIATLCAYKDVSGVFSLSSATVAKLFTEPVVVAQQPAIVNKSFNLDDEDELLYGGGDLEVSAPSKPQDTQEPPPSTSVTKEPDMKPTFWVILCRTNGDLEIYSLPEFKLYFHVKNFRVGHKLLTDYAEHLNQVRSAAATGVTTPAALLEAAAGGSAKPAGFLGFEQPGGSVEHLEVKEVLMVGLGHEGSRPHLMARVNEELLIYEAFPYHSTVVSSNLHLRLRFRKVPHGLIIRVKRPAGQPAREAAEALAAEERRARGVRWLRPFDDISQYSGVFLCGPYPHFLMMTSRGVLRFHPMSIDGTITCFTPFHNVNCPNGFMYFNKQGELRISVLPTHLSYDAPWPVRKVPLRCTAYYVAYHPDSKTYGVVTSAVDSTNKLVKVVGDGDKEIETVERDDRFVLPTVERFTVQLFSPVSWEAIPKCRYDCDEHERVTCMQTVSLRSEGTLSGRKNYLVCGTHYAYNEDITSKGRVIILDVIEVVPEPGQPLTKNKFKIEYDKEQKGAISAIDGVQGLLVTAIGQKIYIWQLEEDGSLKGVAFIDAQVYVHQVCAVKNLILIGDVFKSVTLLRYQEELKILSLVSRDVKPSQVYSIAYLVDSISISHKLNFLVSDRQKNLLVYAYQPEVKESCGGQRLSLVGDINIGSHVTTFFRVRSKQLDPSTDRRAYANLKDRHITYFATLDGSIGYLSPISEKTFRRLQMLQNALNNHIAHTAGLNPKGYRMAQLHDQPLTVHHKSVVDGDLVWKYLSMSAVERAEIAHRIGASQEQIITDLVDIDRTTAHF